MLKEETVKKLLLMACVAVLFGGLSLSTVRAQQKTAQKPTVVVSDDSGDLSNVSGTVNVTKDKKTGEVTDLELLTESGFKFKITRDAESKYLEAQNGKSVEVAGLISVKDGLKWVTIKKPTVMAPVDDKVAEGKVKKADKDGKGAQKPKKPAKKVNFGY